MGTVPTIERAEEIVRTYNKEPFHITHAQTVGAVMGWFAAQHDPERVDYWRVVGMLHDVDFEMYPDQHCVKGEELLRSEGVDESVIRSAMSHGYGVTDTPHTPDLLMEKILFAVDELTGLIGAVAIMRPSRSVSDLELPSVKKKFKDKRFAAGCSREIIEQGAQQLDMSLDDLITETILAMRAVEADTTD
ncbi:MAG: hydrolase [Propionibacteriaceae bacterium]|nr:hydrolase [Propionibacteriaceae bacterium]